MRYGPTPPRQLPVQDTQRMLVMIERWQRSTMAHGVWAEGAKTCVDFMEGRQWTAGQLAEMAAGGRPALTFNIIAPLVRLISGYQRNNKTDIMYRPGNDERATEDVAEALSQIEKAVSAMTKQQHVDTEVFLDGILGGRGFFRSVLDFENNDLGEIKCCAVDPFTVYLDPDGDSYDLNESSSYVNVSKYVSIDQIEDNYGKMIGDLLRPFVNGRTPQSPIINTIVNDEITPQRYFGSREDGLVDWWDSFYATMGEFVDTARKSIRVVEQEHVVRERRQVAIDLETGDTKILPAHVTPDYIAKLEHHAKSWGNPIRVEQRAVKKVWWTTICGDMILYDQPSPYDSFSITPFFPYFRRGITRGAVEDLLDPQREKNKRRSVEIEMVSKLSNGGWMYSDQSLDPINEAHLRNFGAAPGVIIKYKGNAENKPQQISPAAPPTSHERLEQKADMDVHKISGINESAMGNIDKVQSGRAIEGRQRQALVAIQMYFDNFTRSKQLVGEKRLELYQGHYTEQRLYRILGENGRIVTKIINQAEPVIDPVTQMQKFHPLTGNPVVRILNDITVGKYLAWVDETPMSATFAQAQFDEMIVLMEKMGPAMQQYLPAFADLMMDVSSLPRKDDWVERFKIVSTKILGFDPTGEQPVPMIDQATGQPMINPATGQPIMMDPKTGMPIDPAAQAMPGAAPGAPGAVPPGPAPAQLPPPGAAPAAAGAPAPVA